MLIIHYSLFIIHYFRPGGQAVKTPPFHGGNTGSIPVRVNWERKGKELVFLPFRFLLYRMDIAEKSEL